MKDEKSLRSASFAQSPWIQSFNSKDPSPGRWRDHPLPVGEGFEFFAGRRFVAGLKPGPPGKSWRVAARWIGTFSEAEMGLQWRGVISAPLLRRKTRPGWPCHKNETIFTF